MRFIRLEHHYMAVICVTCNNWKCMYIRGTWNAVFVFDHNLNNKTRIISPSLSGFVSGFNVEGSSFSMSWLKGLFLSLGLTKLYRTLCTSWSPASSKVRARRSIRVRTFMSLAYTCVSVLYLRPFSSFTFIVGSARNVGTPHQTATYVNAKSRKKVVCTILNHNNVMIGLVSLCMLSIKPLNMFYCHIYLIFHYMEKHNDDVEGFEAQAFFWRYCKIA